MTSDGAIPAPDHQVIARDYEPQLLAAARLLTTVWDNAPRRPEDEVHMLLMNLLGRSMGTYRALIHLLRGGFSDEAWMLNRSMFEDLVFAFWVALPENRDGAVELVDQHLDDASDRIDYLLDRVKTEGLSAFVTPGDAEKDWKGRPPLVRSLDKMVTQIEPLWEQCGGSVPELHAQRAAAHWRSNLALHTTGTALMEALTRGSVKVGAARSYRYGQSAEVQEVEMLHGFRLAAFRFGWLARLVLIEAGRPLAALETAYAAVTRAADELTPSKLRQFRPNDPCWCGSEQKFKKCHGRTASAAITTSSRHIG